VDWANIGSPTTTVGLSGTTIKTATDVETDTADIQTRLPAALVSGRMSSDAVAISGSTAAADNVEANIGNLDAAVTTRLAPTVAGRTLDVSAGGEAGVDWANIGSPTTTVGLSGTTVGTTTALGTGAVTAAAVATGAIDADALAADAVDKVLDEVVETGGTITMRQVLMAVLAFVGGRTNGGGTATINFRNQANTVNRIQQTTVDADGNRGGVTLDFS
jgi:hypothetical protein